MENGISVLLVGNFLSGTSGSRGVCEELAERFMMVGWTVFTTSRKPGRVARLFDMLNTVWSKRHKYKIAYIEVFSGPAFIWAEVVCFVLNRLGKPYILSLHGGNLPDFAQRWPKRVTRLLKPAQAVTVPSRYLLEGMGLYRHDLVLVPNPIDIQSYPFQLRSSCQPILVWLRAFHDIYNPPMAIRAATLLIPKFTGFRLFMGGGDKGDGSLQKTQKEAILSGVADFIEFPGKIPKANVPEWLQQGDIFINTTNVDNAPVSILEAMACGLCIVSTNVGGIPYLLEDEKNALLVPQNDPVAMADAVSRILTQPGLSSRLSENARRKVEQYDWSVVLPLWENLLCKGAKRV